ncbi:beta-2 adrenergic receptor-like [Antedon mediterranea]|uniref:beta-2 adrenergic receptor-like n=1 Tax=Antedon mediterranea TaxID=105859 RepID=UPI003AF9CB29
MPFSIDYYFSGIWKWGSIFCEVWLMTDFVSCTASMFTLCTIAGVRFVSIKWPFYYSSKMSKRVICTLIVCIWLTSSCWAGIPVGLKLDRPRNYTRPEGTCYLIYNIIYSILSAFFTFYFSLIIICTLYYKLYNEAKIQSKKINAINAVTSSCLHQARRRENKAAITIGIIVGCFVLCWLPYFTVNNLIAHLPGVYINLNVFFGLTWLGYLNSAINPYLYIVFTNNIKTTLLNYFKLGENQSSQVVELRNIGLNA